MSVTDARYSAVIVDQVDKAGKLPDGTRALLDRADLALAAIGALGPPVRRAACAAEAGAEWVLGRVSR